MPKMTHIFEIAGVFLNLNENDTQNRESASNAALHFFMEEYKKHDYGTRPVDAEVGSQLQKHVEGMHAPNEPLLIELIHFLSTCGDSVRFVEPRKSSDPLVNQAVLFILGSFVHQHPKLLESLEKLKDASDFEPIINAEEKQHLPDGSYTWTSGDQVQEDASHYSDPTYLLNVLEKAYENLDTDKKTRMQEHYVQLKSDIEIVRDHRIANPTEEKIAAFRVTTQKKSEPAPLLASTTIKTVRTKPHDIPEPQQTLVESETQTAPSSKKETAPKPEISTTKTDDAAQTPPTLAKTVESKQEGATAQAEETQEAPPAPVVTQPQETLPSQKSSSATQEKPPFEMTKEMRLFLEGEKAKLTWYQRNIKVPLMLLGMLIKLNRPKYSWYERNIKHPFMLYFAKRAFKRNRLDTFKKWVSRLPEKLNFIIDPKNKDTLHLYIAKEIEKNHNKANTLIQKQKELDSKLAGNPSEKERRRLILQKKRLHKDLRKANRYANDALQFFLELNYNTLYQPLHDLHSQLSPEAFDKALKTIASRYEVNAKADITDILDPVLANASALQKAVLAFAISPYTKGITHTLLSNENTDPEAPASPQSIVLNLFSKNVSAPATFHHLKSLENKNRLSPYHVFLNEIEARIQKNRPEARHRASKIASKTGNISLLQAFQGWLVSDKPQVNLTQQSQSQAEQTQTTQQSQLLAVRQKLDPALEQKRQENTKVPFRVVINEQHQIIAFYYDSFEFVLLEPTEEGWDTSAKKEMERKYEEARAEVDQAYEEYEEARNQQNKINWGDKEAVRQTQEKKEQAREKWEQASAKKNQAWEKYRQESDKTSAQQHKLNVAKEFFRAFSSSDKHRSAILGKDHSGQHTYEKPTHLDEIQAWLQAVVNATLAQNQTAAAKLKPPFSLELNVDAATLMAFDASAPSNIPPILSKYTPKRAFIDKPVLAFRVTENSENKIDPDTTHFQDYPFLEKDVLEWLNGIEQQAEQHHSCGFIMLQHLAQAKKSRPHLKLKLPDLETAKKTDLSFGGKTPLRYLLKNILLERHQFGGDAVINDRLRLLMKLDRQHIDCPPFIRPTDKYSFLSLLNDYVFQKMWDSDWYQLATPVACMRFLANPEFQALGEVLLDADSSVLNVLFSVLNYAHPFMASKITQNENEPTQTTIKLQDERDGGTSNVIHDRLPVFLNNYLHLKNLNLWQEAASLLQDGDVDVLDKMMQFGLEQSISANIRDYLHKEKNSTEREDDTGVSKEAYLYYLLFLNDVTSHSKEQIQSLLNSISEAVPPATEQKRVPKETLYGKTKRVDLLEYCGLNDGLPGTFYSTKKLSPSIHDLRYAATSYSDETSRRDYFQSPAFIWNQPFSTNIQIILNQFINLSNTAPRVCGGEQIRFFRNTLEKLFGKYDAPSDEQLIILQGMVHLFLKYIENPMIKSTPLFWEKLIEKYAPFLENNSIQGIQLLNEETARVNISTLSHLNRYVGEAAVQIQQARKQLPEIGMRSFALLSIQGQLSEEDYEKAVELRNELDDDAHAQTEQKRDKRTPLERQQAFAAKLKELTAALPREKQILLHRLQFEEDYETFKIIRHQQNEAVAKGEIPETQAAKAIEAAARVLEEKGSAFESLLKHLNSDEVQNKQFNAQIDALEELKKACDQTKNLSANALKEYIQQHQLALTEAHPKGDAQSAIRFLAAAIRMSELQGVGVPTQSQLYIILHHLQRLKAYQQNPNEQTAVFYQLDAGEGKTLTLQMIGLLDSYFGVRNDLQTHQRDLAKTGAQGIQELANDFFGIQVRDLYRRTEQRLLNNTTNINKDSAASFEDFQHDTLEKAHMVYIDVYDNMLQMAKRTHLKDGPRHGVRDPKETHLSIDEVDHLLDISAKVTAHIAELEKDPKKLGMLHDFYRVLNDGMTKILSDQTLLNALEACKNTDQKRELTKNILLKEAEAKNFPEVLQYINELVNTTPNIFDGWIGSAMTVHTVLKQQRNQLYTFETETRNGQEVQVLYIALKDTSGKIMRDAQWSAGVHQLLSDYWRNEQIAGRDKTPAPYLIPPLSNTVLHTGVELLGDAYYFITGVTATLGSDEDIEQLKSLFPGKKIEILRLPPSTPNRRFDYAPLVTNEVFEDFYEAMVESLEQKEPILIRFESIEQVEAYQAYCRERNPNCIPYMFDDKRRSESPMAENLVIRKLADGGVGVMTNAGGRGTDFKNIKRLLMANAASAGTRPTIQAKRRAGRFGQSAITQVMITKEELGLLMHSREFSKSQQKKLFKPLKQGFFESTENFQKRLNEQRLAQKRAHTQLIKIDLLKDLQQRSTVVQKKISKKAVQKMSLLDPEKKHIVFATKHLQLKQAEKDSVVNSESAHKMLHNRIIDAIQTAVMPEINAEEKNHPIHGEWHTCLYQIQTKIAHNNVDEAVQLFKDFAGKHKIRTEQALAKIGRLQAMSSPRPVK